MRRLLASGIVATTVVMAAPIDLLAQQVSTLKGPRKIKDVKPVYPKQSEELKFRRERPGACRWENPE